MQRLFKRQMKLKKILKKFVAGTLALSAGFFLTSCGAPVENAYNGYLTPAAYGITKTAEAGSEEDFFAANLCVTDDTDLNTDTVDSQVAAAAGVFNTATGSVTYKQNIFGQVYPASTTKILTALVAMKYGDLDKSVTVSENAVNLGDDSSSVANLHVGDVLTIRQLMYGLMLVSGNDAAVAIAEGVSGDTDTFVALMNQEAKALGATHSNFVNPHGLPDANHYTTVYDMYLIMNAAIRYTDFIDVVHAVSYDAYYTDASGNPVSRTWTNTNQYISGYRRMPDGIEVIGGKSGTTGAAGYCLVLLSKNAAGQDIISCVYGADAKTNLYLLTGEILSAYGV